MSISIRHERFHRHAQEQLDAALALVAAPQTRKVLVLSGEAGSGRRAFLEAVAERETQRGQATRVVSLSLDGFEPTGPGLAGFVEFLLTFDKRHPEPVHAELRRALAALATARDVATSARWAALFGLAVALDEPLALMAAVLESTPSLLAAIAPEEVFTRWLALQTQVAQWIIHIPAEQSLSDPLTQWLVERVAGHARVTLAVSCSRSVTSDAAAGAARGFCTPLRLELAQPAPGPTLVEHPLSVWIASLGDDSANMLQLLQLAAACGDVVPILPLLASLGMSQQDAERFIDRIDEDLCGHDESLALFDDLAYRHPGFPGLSVYRFASASGRHVLRDLAERAAFDTAAHALWTFLGTRMAVVTRSVAQLFVNLVDRAQPELAAGPRQRLRLWVGPEDALTLQQLLSDDVRAGRLPSAALFTTAQRDAGLPAHQRLALLEASELSTLQPDPTRAERRLAVHVLRTELLCAAGRFEHALASAGEAQTLLAQQPAEPHGVRGLLLFLTANCQRQLGRVEQALAAFSGAASEAAKPRPDGTVDFHNVAVCLAETGHCHAERGEWAPATQFLTDAIAHLKRGNAEGHVQVEQLAQLERNLAICQAKLEGLPEPA